MHGKEPAEGDALDNEQEGSFVEDGVRRPMNAFFIFCKRHRDVVREKYPHLENRSITKILGEWWANLDASEKALYTTLAKQYKEAFMKAHPDFKWYKLPTAPTRTLVTRPSNTRCATTMKKEKTLSKSSCGITLGKLADDEHLGGLSSLLATNSSDTCAPPGDSQVLVTGPVTSSSSNNILKPPKKRYLINGEFMCNSDTKSYDGRDDQTQNACSALLELAEICANTASRSLPCCEPSVIADAHCVYSEVTNYVPTNCYKSSLLKTHPTATTISPAECNPLLSIASSSYIKSPEFLSHNAALSVPYLQEQPLNLCKQKGKTFTASNQQLIDHLVDKFLCEPPQLHVKSPLDLQVPNYPPIRLPSPDASNISCQSFTLSAAIESAIDQAYNKDIVQPVRSESPEIKIPSITAECKNAAETTTAKIPSLSIVTNSNSASNNSNVESEGTEVVFIDKIKKACLASSWKSSEKPVLNRYSPRILACGVQVGKAVVKIDSRVYEEDSKSKSKMQLEHSQDESCSSNAIPNKPEAKFSSSKYYSKFASPPKKSQVWCKLFMKEQLENSDSDGSVDVKKTAMLDSPVRRNSQRTCKGRRYQALITEGLLQSSKERKAAAGKKPFPAAEKCRIKSSSVSEIPPVILKSKRRKKEAFEKSKSLEKEEEEEDDDDSDGDKSGVFDLNEKIASLPKCSIEILNKRRKLSASSSSISKSGSGGPSTESKKMTKDSSISRQAEDNAPKSRQDDSASSGRFKTGNFDLEQHIASLPKCDIEVLNKRRNKRE